ncbi:MAG: ACP S-malonyltransferase [Acidobacteriota bacterium]|nr:MAG: ACP S-malonyltransferase [Acidobacteriota bacterium]
MIRAALLFPGRGSYTESSLGSLPADHPWVLRAEQLRAEFGLGSLLELDGATKLRASVHLQPANVSPLIYLVSMLDGELARTRDQIVCIGGNSLGWYTALAASGALTFDDGLRLVQQMSLLQQQHPIGGQLIYPIVDEKWRAAPQLARAVEKLLEASEGQLLASIELGGYRVLAGSDQALRRALAELPPLERGSVSYPLKLVRHGAYHTPLAAPVAARAAELLAELSFRKPRVTLVDGRGVRFTPWSTHPAELRDYTLRTQVVTPYDVTQSVRVMLREYAPERIVLPGPGNTLGGVVGQIIVAEGFRSVKTRAAFDRTQRSECPLLDSMRR